MKPINTDETALIGPGSEWLWTALSGLVLAATFIAIWRQLSMARSANAALTERAGRLSASNLELVLTGIGVVLGRS